MPVINDICAVIVGANMGVEMASGHNGMAFVSFSLALVYVVGRLAERVA